MVLLQRSVTETHNSKILNYKSAGIHKSEKCEIYHFLSELYIGLGDIQL